MNLSLSTKCALITSVTLWSSAFVAIRAGLLEYSPGGMALMRYLIASFIIFCIFIQRKHRQSIPIKDILLALFSGTIGIGVYNITLNYGEIEVPAGIASFIISQSPIISAALAILFLRERLSLFGTFGMAISVAGVTLIAAGEAHEFNFYLSILYIFIATFTSGLYSILQKPLVNKYHFIDMTAYAIWGGTLVLLLFTPDLIQDIHRASYQTTAIVIYLGIFPAALAFLAWGYVLNQINAMRAVSFLYFSPLVATLLGWLWLAEIPSLLAFAGGLIAICGVMMVNKSYQRKPLIELSDLKQQAPIKLS